MDVYPVHLFDNATSYRNLFLTYVLTFNDVLNPQKLVDSLRELLRNGDWRKFGGRFRFNNDKSLEIHVPQQCSEDLPAITFSQRTVDSGIDSHPLGTWLRSPENHCTVQQPAGDLRDFAGIPSTPQSMEEMMDRDAPLLSLHVTSFADATVVAISWPHPLMDAMGLQALLRNWSLVLNDKADEVQPLVGNHDDPLREVLAHDTSAREDLLLEKHSLGLLGSIVLLFRMLWMKLWEPVFEMRTIILPQNILDRFCSQARADGATNGDGKGPAFISEGDIFTGWAAKMLAASQSTPRPISVATIVNLRFRLSALQEQKGEYVNNLLQFVYAFFTPSCATEPVGVTALRYRQQLAAQSTKGQILSCIDMQRRHVETKGSLKLLYGDPTADMLTTNNLAKLDFFHNIDFSAAVFQRGDLSTWGMSRRNPPGTIVYYHPLELTKSFRTSHLRTLGKDYGGRTLITGIFPPKTWELIRKELETL